MNGIDDKSLNVKLGFDPRSLSMRLEEAMETLLKEYRPGDRLPSEEQLSKMMGVSRATIRELHKSLEERGRIVRRHGIGTFVATNNPLFEEGLERLISLDAIARKMGIECGTRDLEITEKPADASMADKLNIPLGSPVCILTRTRIMQDVVIAYLYDIIPATLASVEELRLRFTGSVLEYFNMYKPIPRQAITNIHSIQANKEIARAMNISPRSALLLLEETLYSSDDQILNYSQNYYNTKYFRYHVLRTAY